MAVNNLTSGQIKRPQKRQAQVTRVPAPYKGIDTRSSITVGNAEQCIYTYNLMPFEYGMRVRKGFREWSLELDEGAGAGVHTLIPFDGIEEDGVNDRLFAVTNEGIWDVTVLADPPILKFTFADQDPVAGYGVYAHYVGNDETDVLFYADAKNGLFSYDPDTEVWAQATGIMGPVIANIRFIVLHKQRLWMIEENSTKAWYLPVGSIAGQSEEFFFGSKFKHGGNLQGLYNWSVDGGAGVDDFLVAVSRSGDVLPYQGEDPSTAATWGLKGTYFIGEVPRGPFVGSEHGGELFLLSAFGLTGMNDLLQGVQTLGLGEQSDSNSMAGKIAWLLRDDMQTSIDKFGWAVRSVPNEGQLVVQAPQQESGEFLQYVFNISTSAWGLWRGVPMSAFDSWRGNVVFGSAENNVYTMDVTADNVQITPPAEGLNGDPVEFSILTSFQAFGAEGVYKRVKLLRPDFISNAPPTHSVQARYDYDISEAIKAPTPPLSDGSLWDVGLWDTAIWGTGWPESFSAIGGAWGYGRYIAVAMKGNAREKTIFIGWDLFFDTGGPLV